jgi:hypothetical protein
MFGYASAKDVQMLTGMKERVRASGDPGVADAYSVALYLAAPVEHRQQFVRNFPTTYDRLMKGLYTNVELEGLTPEFLYSFEALGELAVAGDPQAIATLLRAASHSDGVVAKVLYDSACTVSRGSTRAAFQSGLAALSPSERAKVTSTLPILCE